MILIENSQTAIPINTQEIERIAQILLNALNYTDYDLGILITTNEEMHDYNKDYRGQDKPTDILSFPYHPDLRAGERINTQTQDDKNLGDIILAPQYIMDDLERWEQSFETRMKVLLVHGICHLLGYDHIEDADYEIMKQKEEELLALL
ncbi:MAG: rRNA maturation RNase YbeY [Candidatus Babeliales bacterium]